MTQRKIALSIEEAADYTGIGRNTLRQLVEWKKLPVLKVGRKVLIKTDILEMFMEANEGRDLRDGTIQKIVNYGGVSGQRCVMNIFLCIIRSITVLMKNRENSRFLPSMKVLTQERLNKSFLSGRK